MSCLSCERCCRLIDTDWDVEAYVTFTSGHQSWRCEPCRDDLEFNDDGLAVEPD
jgi:hypothetical protein